ncbi:MAG TPA: FAD-dependent monooxygenase, partial [Mycobacterium sp.]|nr:FAD-dependent monooxygenase [Mycobacterium sp.]
MPETHSPKPRAGTVLDPDAVAQKYAEERSKRLRPEGTAQYRPVEIGSALEADPFVKTVEPRQPVQSDVEVAIVGAGFSGLLSAVRLSEAGVKDFLIVDK